MAGDDEDGEPQQRAREESGSSSGRMAARTNVAHAQERVEILAWRSANYARMQRVFAGVTAAQDCILGRMFRCWVRQGLAAVMR